MSRHVSEQDHKRVVDCGIDVPQQYPEFPLPLTEVGISSKTVWVHLPQGRLPFTARLEVDLLEDVRGIHMSRMEETIACLYEKSFVDLRSYGLELARQILRRQEANRSAVFLSGQLPSIRQTAVSKRSSLDTVDISAEVQVEKSEGAEEFCCKTFVGAGENHITACPCTQVYNETLFEPEGSLCPMPTHSQRSYTKLLVESAQSRPTYDELFDCLGTALHITQDLLKRPDEAEIVLKAHRRPQFAEDAVRDTAKAVGEHFGGVLPPSSRIIIESISLESIHIHDVRCRVDTTLGEILKRLKGAVRG